MSDEQAAVIDTGAEVSVPDGEVTHEQLVKILQDARDADPDLAEEAAAKPAEPEKAAEKPKDERVSARIIAAKRAEMKAAAERQAIAKARAEAEATKASAADFVKVAEQVKAAKLSPSKALELLGMDAKTFLETLASEEEPEAIANRMMSVEQAEREKLAAELKALREEREAEKRAIAQQRDAAEVQNLQKGFVDHVGSQADLYPHLVADYTDDEIASLGWKTALEHSRAYAQQFGEPPSDSVIAEYLESQARARAERRAAQRSQLRQAAPTLPSQGSAIQGRPTQAVSPRTLTNGTSTQRTTPTKPWTQADADAESKRILQEMFSQANDD